MHLKHWVVFNNQHAGSFGDIGIISFNGNKIITTGGGGAVVTNSSKLSNKIKELTTICRKKLNRVRL